MKAFVEYLLKAMSENRRLAYGFVLILLLSEFIALRAVYNFHAAVQEEIDTKKESLSLLASVVQHSGRGGNENEMERLRALENRLVKADKPSIAAAFLQKEFKSAASKNNVMVVSGRPLKYLEVGVYILVPIEFQLKTGLPGLKGLLSDLCSSNLSRAVESINIKTSENGMLDVTLVIQGAMRNQI